MLLFNSLYILLVSAYLCLALQPFGRAVIEAGKAFFGMEQKKGALRGLLEYETGKCFDQLRQKVYECYAAILISFPWCYLAFLIAEKTALEKRVKELEESLAARSA